MTHLARLGSAVAIILCVGAAVFLILGSPRYIPSEGTSYDGSNPLVSVDLVHDLQTNTVTIRKRESGTGAETLSTVLLPMSHPADFTELPNPNGLPGFVFAGSDGANGVEPKGVETGGAE